ncbi:type II secretion system F family protein [Egicoccus sp. AB-alg2]|uniref:type II secretion system F family protein n=1 Tax=Egicoccus sp. AB-alg2 TaxID=3242693 RepID=UPI00359CE34E
MDATVPWLFASALAGCVVLAGVGTAMLVHQPIGDRLPGAIRRRERRGAGQRRPPLTALLDQLGSLLAGSAAAGLGESRLAAIDELLDAAGRPGGLSAREFAGRKAAFALLMVVPGVIFAVGGTIWPVVVLPLTGWFLPDLDLKGKADDRQEEITRALPDFLDVLSVTVSAGLDFRAALGRVADSFEGPLYDEVRIALQQMALGESRRQALTDLRGRNRSESLSEFVSALQQAEDLGAPLTGALRDIAEDVRRAYAQEARRAAAKVEPRLSVLTTLTLIPAAMIVIAVGFWITNEIDLGGLFGGG